MSIFQLGLVVVDRFGYTIPLGARHGSHHRHHMIKTQLPCALPRLAGISRKVISRSSAQLAVAQILFLVS